MILTQQTKKMCACWVWSWLHFLGIW